VNPLKAFCVGGVMIFKAKPISKKHFILGLYLFLLALVCPAIFLLLNNKNHKSEQGLGMQQLSLKSLFGFNLSHQKRTEQRMSLGNTVLITADNFPEKQAAVQAFAVGDYTTAISRFRESLRNNPNDPESLIYLNNAIAAKDNKAIKVAVSVPIGSNLSISKEILRGVAQLQNEVNQTKGSTEKLLQILIVNDDNDPAIARQIATTLINDPNILAVIGHNSSKTTLAAAPLYQQGKLMMISPTSVAQKLSGIGQYIFRTTPSVRVTAANLAQYVINTARSSKVAICAASGFDASQSFKDEFIWNLAQAGQKISDISCDFSDPNFKAEDIPSQAVANGADALLLAPSAETIRQAIEVLKANKKRLPLFGNQTLNVAETLQSGQMNANGMILSVPWYPEAIPDSSFPEKAQKLWGTSVSWRTAMAYDAALVIADALKFGTTRERLQKTLLNPGFSVKGSTGAIQFLPTGDRSMKGFLVQVQPGKKSSAGHDFVAVQPNISMTSTVGGKNLP
jgi:branched-chain amino acid transport system substrate-binding protein